jgi:hypothetical protein
VDTQDFGPTPEAPEGLSRREALKRGLRLTGAVLWATPVVQAIGMSPALAQTTSPVCETFESFRAKANWVETEFVWEASPGVGAQDCTDCGGASGVNGALYFSIAGDETSVTVTLLNPECEITAIAHKAGQNCFNGTVAPDGNSATATIPTGGQDISHIEVCFRCCEVPTIN